MSQINVSEFQVPGCHLTGPTAKLRLYWDQDWTDSLGVLHLSSPVGSKTGYFQLINCTISVNVLDVPAFITYSTIDARQNPTVTVTGVVFDAADSEQHTLFENWYIPESPLTTTRTALEAVNQSTMLLWPPPTYLDSIGVQQLIDIALGIIRFATSLIAGWVRLSKPADVTSDPIAVGANDYAGVGHNGIVSLTTAPADASLPKAVSDTDPRINDTVGSNIPTDGTDAYAIFNAVVAEQVALPATEQREIRLPSGNILISRPLQIKGFCTIKPSPGGQPIIQGTFGAGPTIVTKQSVVNIDTGPSLVPGPGVSMRLRPGAFPWLPVASARA